MDEELNDLPATDAATEGPDAAGDAVTSAADQAAGATAEPAASLLDRAIDLLLNSGPVVMILIALSIFAMIIVIAKALHLSAARLGFDRALRAALDAQDAGAPAEALRLAKTSRAAAAPAIVAAIDASLAGAPETKARERAERIGAETVESLRGWLRPLEVVASIAPLLGLFGTVLGMIESFAAMEAAGANVDPAILSGGIWQALLTTAVGLAIAIPAVAAVNWFERRIERFEHRQDDAISRAFTPEAMTREPARPAVRVKESDYGHERDAVGAARA